MRFAPFLLILLGLALGIVLLVQGFTVLGAFFTGIFGLLTLVVIWQLSQRKHALLRNYPISGFFRYLAEELRPMVQQYFVENDLEGAPFSRRERDVVYRRAKNVEDNEPFGTELDVYNEHYEWMNHSIIAREKHGLAQRVIVGNSQCSKPYRNSMLNISAMSFGALGENAIRALNKGAQKGGFAHNTGEGGISRYHREFGGDLTWEIGTGYFGCRAKNGGFDPEAFRDQASSEQVKMIELKLSQGAKPGKGGMLPGAKVTAEVAEARGIEIGKDCDSPSSHREFNTPIQMLEFIAKLRELSGGKPTGFKLCIGHRWEFMAICKAMLETGIYPDFIVIDGAEGGTGAAPPEFPAHVGTPLREGLLFARNVLNGTGLKQHVKLAAAGKITTGFRMASNMALGADWCYSARGFMFALGCLQSQSCHTGGCPTGVATQDPWRQRALDVDDKAERVYNFHRHTIDALSNILAAVGVESSEELRPEHLFHRSYQNGAEDWRKHYSWLDTGELLADGESNLLYRKDWAMSRANSFAAKF